MDGSWDTVAIGLLVIAVMGAAKRAFTHERPSVRFFQWWSRSSIAAMAAMPVGLRAPAAPPGGAKEAIDGSLSTRSGRHAELWGAAFPPYPSPNKCLR